MIIKSSFFKQSTSHFTQILPFKLIEQFHWYTLRLKKSIIWLLFRKRIVFQIYGGGGEGNTFWYFLKQMFEKNKTENMFFLSNLFFMGHSLLLFKLYFIMVWEDWKELKGKFCCFKICCFKFSETMEIILSSWQLRKDNYFLLLLIFHKRAVSTASNCFQSKHSNCLSSFLKFWNKVLPMIIHVNTKHFYTGIEFRNSLNIRCFNAIWVHIYFSQL